MKHKTTTPMFRMNYPFLFKPRVNSMNGNEEYSLTALFPKGADLTRLRAKIEEVIQEKWGSKRPANLRMPLRQCEDKVKVNEDGEESLPNGYEADGHFANLKNSRKPGVVDTSVSPILDETEIYSGCWALASVNPFAYDIKGSRGVSLSLVNVQKLNDGDALAGRSRPEDDFKPVAVETAGSGSAEELFK